MPLEEIKLKIYKDGQLEESGEYVKDGDNYCGGSGISYNNVTEGVTISSITFNYMPPSECFSRICKLTGRGWYIDYDKDVHYGLVTANEAPYNIDI